MKANRHYTSSRHIPDPFYYDDQDALAAGLRYADTEASALRPHLEMIRAFHAEERPDFIDPPGEEYRAPATPDQLVLLGGLICLLDARHGIVSKDWPQSAD